MHKHLDIVAFWLEPSEASDLPEAPAEATDPLDQGRSHEVIQLVDHSGVTWMRHFCRSCRKAPLWAVLGEPTPMCRECREHMFRPEPLGYHRFDRLPSDFMRQESQYHGELPYAES